MKGPILGLCLLLLVSAAAATGSDNCVTVWNNQEVSGNCITGAGFAQITTAEANLLGNCNEAIQFLDLAANCNIITGANDGRTNFIQCGDMLINDTGCDNFDLQAELLAANDNCLTIGNITQAAEQDAEDSGNCNYVVQITGAAIGPVQILFFPLGSPNYVTNSDLSEFSSLDACVTGSDNLAAQVALQGEFDNCLTDSKLYEQASVNANILGCDNNGIYFPAVAPFTDSLETVVGPYSDGGYIPLPIQVTVQYADCNTLTRSWVNQMNCLDEEVTGSCNSVGQFALTGVSDNCVTLGSVLQMSDMKALSLGCNNDIGQSVNLDDACNTITGGHLSQQVVINTND